MIMGGFFIKLLYWLGDLSLSDDHIYWMVNRRPIEETLLVNFESIGRASNDIAQM